MGIATNDSFPPGVAKPQSVLSGSVMAKLLLKASSVSSSANGYAFDDQASQDAFDYIEMFHNPKHIEGGVLSTTEFERQQEMRPRLLVRLSSLLHHKLRAERKTCCTNGLW